MPATKCDEIAKKTATVAIMDNLQAMMIDAGMSQTDLSDTTGIDRSVINQLCQRAYKSSLSVDAALAIAHALGSSLERLISK